MPEEKNETERVLPKFQGKSLTGGVYIPPHKLAQRRQEIQDPANEEYQKLAWEALKKSINGLMNKLNTKNIHHLVKQLFKENLIRGRGLLARAIIRAQMASPGFTHIYTTLLCVLNSKLPDIGLLIIHRVLIQFNKSFQRNDKVVTLALLQFISHMINQKILDDVAALQLATMLLENPTNESIEMAIVFLRSSGNFLLQEAPEAIRLIFDRLRTILQEGQVSELVQQSLEVLFGQYRQKFQDFPYRIESLDLLDEEDIVTHSVDIQDVSSLRMQEGLNVFKAVSGRQYEMEDKKWLMISRQILGESDSSSAYSSTDSEGEERKEEEKESREGGEERRGVQRFENGLEVKDYSEQELVAVRKKIYLMIVSSATYEECAHKIRKEIKDIKGEKEVAHMLLDCCNMEKSFQTYFPLIAENLCRVTMTYATLYQDIFQEQYAQIHRYETNKLKNTANFFAHLLSRDAIPWVILQCLEIGENVTTSSQRIFIKFLFQELSSEMGIQKLVHRVQDKDLRPFLHGLFPQKNIQAIRYSINYFFAIGLNPLVADLRVLLDEINKKKALKKASKHSDDSSDSSSSSSSDSDSSDSGSSSDSSSDSSRSSGSSSSSDSDSDSSSDNSSDSSSSSSSGSSSDSENEG